MGQYYKIVNLDKKQYLYSHAFGDGLKLLEFGSSGDGMMCGLAILLADGNGRGGGDLRSDDAIIGSWAGDRIVVAGDYADPGKFGAPEDKNIYQLACSKEDEGSGEYTDISYQVIIAMADDSYLREALNERIGPKSYRAKETPKHVLKALKPRKDS